jgi:hypothetical protein
MGGWFKREINSLSDLPGLKMRIPGMGGEVMAAAGGQRSGDPRWRNLPGPGAGGRGCRRVGRSPRRRETGTAGYRPVLLLPRLVGTGCFSGSANEPQLPGIACLPSTRRPSQTACYEANLNMLSAYESVNGAALQRLLDQGTLNSSPYTEDILEAGQTAAFELYEENAARMPPSSRSTTSGAPFVRKF